MCVNQKNWFRKIIVLVVVALSATSLVHADAVTDWNQRAGDIVVAADIGPLPADRALAMVQAAVYEAVNAITKRYAVSDLRLKALSDASVEAAIAAANRNVLLKLLPVQAMEINEVYINVLSAVTAGGEQRAAGVAVGEAAAAGILAKKLNDGAAAGETYRPFTNRGVYVPTIIPEAPQWATRKPWLMKNAAQFRPGPPPELESELWVRDYNEVKTLGERNSKRRSIEQTRIALFWEEVMPPIYHGIVRSIANQPDREITQNARLFAAVTQASDDALIAVFDAKYHYAFWRPLTAIRNGDIDDNDKTERDPAWLPLISTPMHPEYPCAHCIVAAAVGTVLQAEIGDAPPPLLKTVSNAAGGETRSWKQIEDFVNEVVEARIYDGVHYRNSGEVGTAMGEQIGSLAAQKYFKGNN